MGSRSGAVGWVIQEACQGRTGGSGWDVPCAFRGAFAAVADKSVTITTNHAARIFTPSEFVSKINGEPASQSNFA